MSIKDKFQANIKEQIEQLLMSYGIDDVENKLITKDLLLITKQEIRQLEKPITCVWIESDLKYEWTCKCGNEYIQEWELPEGFKYCPYCGKEIQLITNE